MKTYKQIVSYKRLRNETAWKLLATDNAPITLALLTTHLLEKERRLPSSILHERINRELDQLRVHGEDLPQTAQNYISTWLSSGFLERSYEPQAKEEMYELSAATAQAIRFIQGLTEKRTVATESRLSLVIQQLGFLAEQTEPDPESRIKNLLKEQQRIDAEIEAIREGKFEMLADDRALERAREIVALTDELANDFLQVRTRFQELNRQLRESIVENEGSRGDVLQSLFAGVDVISESDEGRTFRAFWRLLTDPEQSMELEIALEQILSRNFADQLERGERRFLLQLTRTLLERGEHVHEVLQHFARGLKQFVQSREYQEQRRINKLLKSAQRKALSIKDEITLSKEIGYTLTLSSSKLASISQWTLRDPSLDEVNSDIHPADGAEISLESIGELVAQSEIDFRDLKQNIRSLLECHDQISIAQVLENYPAEQGLGSIIGYISLGSRHGIVSKEKETVNWSGMDTQSRQATIPCIYFVSERSNEFR
jgi:Protein of unknown function (DUF3375)